MKKNLTIILSICLFCIGTTFAKKTNKKDNVKNTESRLKELKEKKQELRKLKKQYKEINTKAGEKEVAQEEKWIASAQDLIKDLGSTLQEFLPAIAIESIRKYSTGTLLSKGKRNWRKSDAKGIPPRGEVVIIMFPEEKGYPGVPDYNKMLFAGTIGKGDDGNLKYTYIKYLGNGKAMFEKWGSDENGKWTKLKEKEKVYPPMYITGEVTKPSQEAVDLSKELNTKEQTFDKESEKVFDEETLFE